MEAGVVGTRALTLRDVRTRPSVSFGRYRIDAARREVWSDGTPLKLGGRAFDVLTALLERRDRLVGKRCEDAARDLQVLAELSRSRHRDAFRCMPLLAYALALAKLERLAEARDVVLEALPLLLHTGLVSLYVPTLALVALKRGRPDSAMRLLAAGDARLARGRLRRQVLEERAEREVRQAVAAAYTDEQIASWTDEGRRLDEQAFARIVIDRELSCARFVPVERIHCGHCDRPIGDSGRMWCGSCPDGSPMACRSCHHASLNALCSI